MLINVINFAYIPIYIENHKIINSTRIITSSCWSLSKWNCSTFLCCCNCCCFYCRCSCCCCCCCCWSILTFVHFGVFVLLLLLLLSQRFVVFPCGKLSLLVALLINLLRLHIWHRMCVSAHIHAYMHLCSFMYVCVLCICCLCCSFGF